MATPAPTALAHDFPILARDGLVYLDSAATAQKPRVVLDAMEDLLLHHNANVHRGTYPLAVEATDRYEAARARVARFTGSTARETIFTKNVTEAINLVAYAWGRSNVGPGDAIVLTVMEHHSNIVPWQLLAEATGAHLRYLDVDDDGRLSLDQLDELLLDRRVRMVAVAHISNVLGTINPLEPIIERAHAAGALHTDRRRRRPCRRSPSTSPRSVPTSTPGRATRPTARPASASCTGAASCSTRCRRSSAADR